MSQNVGKLRCQIEQVPLYIYEFNDYKYPHIIWCFFFSFLFIVKFVEWTLKKFKSKFVWDYKKLKDTKGQQYLFRED